MKGKIKKTRIEEGLIYPVSVSQAIYHQGKTLDKVISDLELNNGNVGNVGETVKTEAVSYRDLYFDKNDLATPKVKWSVAKKLPIKLFNAQASVVINCLTSPENQVTHDSTSNIIYYFKNFIPRRVSGEDTYYVRLKVISISTVAPRLYLMNCGSNGTPQIITGLIAKTGVQDVTCSIGGSRWGLGANINYAIGTTQDEIGNGRNISYEILGIYTKKVTQDFYGIKFTGESLTSSDIIGFDLNINSRLTNVPYVLRGLFVASDYIKDNKIYRWIKKIRVTGDMLDDSGTIDKYKVGSKASYIPLKKSLGVFQGTLKQPNVGWETDLVLSDKICTTTVTSEGLGEINMDTIVMRDIYGFDSRRIVLGLAHGSIGYNKEAEGSLTKEKIFQKYKDYLLKKEIIIYYVLDEPEIELINLELPILEEGDQINTIALYFKNDIDASIHLKIPQEPSNYPRISGKTWLCIGDSITAGVGGFSYEYQAQRYIPTLKFYNIATSGASVCDNSVSPRAWATFAQQQINNKNYFPDYIDLITIALGVNDRKPETVIGTLTDIASDTNNTFYARYKHLIVTLMIRYPFADIVLITPFRTSENPYIKSWGTDPNKFSALDLAKAVKGIGEYFNLHVIDLMSGGGGFYPAKRDDLPRLQNDRWDKFTVDSLHPNDVGHYYLMKRILGELETDLL